MADDRQEALPAEYRPKNLLRVDEAALRRALLGPELVVLAPELGVGQRLVRDRDLLEPLLRVRVVAVLVRVALDRQSTFGIVSMGSGAGTMRQGEGRQLKNASMLALEWFWR